jgi:hypothetical protein
MRAVILHGIMAVPAMSHQQPFGAVPNHFQQHPANGRGGGHVMGNGNGRGGGGRLIVGGAVVSQWEKNRGGSAQQRLVRARKDKEKKPQSAKSQAKRQNQKVTRGDTLSDRFSPTLT